MIIRDMVCMWCGHHEPKSRDSAMREHIRTCEKSEHVQRIAELESQMAITQAAAKIDPSRRRADVAEKRIAKLEAALKEIARGSVDTTMLNNESYLKFIAREALKQRP